MVAAQALREENVAKCLICGGQERDVLYSGLSDKLFNVPGEWTYKQCRRCTLVFLDPRPIPKEIGKAYALYPTHAQTALPDTIPRRLRSYIREGYLARKFGYEQNIGRLQFLVGRLAYLHPGQREAMNGSIMYLPAERRGRVLDVGSGAGATLNELRKLGWEVYGVDPDPQAVDNAMRSYSLNVSTGAIEDRSYPSNHFDSVIMSHVIEHVHNPVDLLAECRRVLKPGGLLVVATPNAESLGSQYFGPSWRVLEPPRHLTVFSKLSLTQATILARLSILRITTTTRGADGIFAESARIRSAPTHATIASPSTLLERARGQGYQYILSLASLFDPAAGEELLMMATKDEDDASSQPLA